VLLYATVVDPKGNISPKLRPENFQVYEDNIEQKLSVFRREDPPASIGVLFDVSGSMLKVLDSERAAVSQFLRVANPDDEFFAVTFGEHALLLIPFTTRPEDIEKPLAHVEAWGRTALLDALYLGLSEMGHARNAKKALLLITDAIDNHSRYSEEEVLRFARETDTQFYVILPFDPAGSRATPEEVSGPDLVNKLTEFSGGRTFAVSNMKDLPRAAVRIGVWLRNQYVLGYEPSNRARDGKWRKIKVKLRPPKGLPPLNVYAKSGYYSPQ